LSISVYDDTIVITNMSNKQSISVISDINKIFSDRFDKNLFAIISVGSLTTAHYRESWSDIDILVVLEQIYLSEKESVSELKSILEKKYGKKFGINVITKHEALRPSFPEILLDGKTLQGLLDLSIYPERLIYCKQKEVTFFVPNNKTIRKYSLSNIAMFLKRNRKALISEQHTEINRLKATAEREIRASFIMTKLAIQYKSGRNCHSYGEIIKRAKSLFLNFDFLNLNRMDKMIKHWNQTKSKKDLVYALNCADDYIESFARLIFK